MAEIGLLEWDSVADLERKSDPARLKALREMFQRAKDKKIARARAKGAKRQREYRAKQSKIAASNPAPAPSKEAPRAMLKKLQKGVASRTPSDRFLEKLVGRERDVVRFRLILELGQRLHGKISDAKVAALSFGTHNPYQSETKKPDNPASSAVGMSGDEDSRALPVIA